MIKLRVSLPVSKNARHMPVKCGRFFKMVRTSACRKKEEQLVAEIWSQLGGRLTVPAFTRPVQMTWTITFPDRRKRDGQNYEESLCDVLQTARVVSDDSLIVWGTRETMPTFERPGFVELTLEEIP